MNNKNKLEDLKDKLDKIQLNHEEKRPKYKKMVLDSASK